LQNSATINPKRWNDKFFLQMLLVLLGHKAEQAFADHKLSCGMDKHCQTFHPKQI
jgi:hypothetical protein